MQISRLNDKLLLQETKQLVQSERQLLTKVLHHLREIERRKLFCDLGYSSLFEYSVKELKYSEGQAGRRIQAMRLIKEIPQVEKSIASGELSLSNVAQAQSVFRNHAKAFPTRPFPISEKVKILKSLKHKSSREGERELLKLAPAGSLVARNFEKERAVSPSASEVSFLMTDDLREKLENVRSLLGSEGADMGLADLIQVMADLSLNKLEEKRFGKRRVAAEKLEQEKNTAASSTPAPELESDTEKEAKTKIRYIPQKVRHEVWRRDKARCTNCGSRRNLHFDHIQPVGLNGKSNAGNLRLLCHNCNQRQGIKTFGLEHQERFVVRE